MSFRKYIDSFVIHYENISNRVWGNIRCRRIDRTDFTIISNNCWGGHVYRRFNLPYLSPTVGLYFYADDYLRFVSDIESNVSKPLRFITCEESRHRDDLKNKGQTEVPIGVLGDDIEIVFLHYSSEQEAFEKWNRRCKRINFSNLIIKNSEMNGCTPEDIKAFMTLPYKKVAFVTEKTYRETGQGTVIKKYANESRVLDDTTYYAQHVDLISLINSKKIDWEERQCR